jgi:rhodanese-related sulfurtransferase
MMRYKNISPVELAARLESGEPLRLIDVREREEYELARIEAAELLPLSRFQEWAGALSPDDEIIVMCHHGIRSAHVCVALAHAGFKRLLNLSGGIDAWSVEVDPELPRY